MENTHAFKASLHAPFGLLITPGFAGQMAEQLDVEVLKQLAREHHLLILRGFAPTFVDSASFTRFAE
ncbi:hypothetical protein [Pseudomonas lundensis]|nr:hypothetical protein [Pseudomonas lundensis]